VSLNNYSFLLKIKKQRTGNS